MSVFGFLSGSQPQQVVVPQYTGVQIQTSSSALPIAIIYGTNIIAPNIIFASGFQAEPIYSGGKHSTITGYNYTQDLLFGVGEGHCARIGLIFVDSDIYRIGAIFSGFATGSNPPVPANGPSFVPAARQMPYAGTAYLYANDFDLGVGASTGTLNCEIHGILDATAGLNGFDADAALVLQDFLTNTVYGLALPAGTLDLTTILSPASGVDRSYQGYCKATEIGLSAALVNTEKANSTITRWLQLTNSGAVWSGGKLKVIPYGDTAITTAQRTGTLTQPIPAIDGDTTDGPALPYIRVNFGFVADLGVVNANTGAAFTLVTNVNSLRAGRYYLSPAMPGRYVFSTSDVNVQVTLTFTYRPLTSYTPNLVPVYDLTDDDFVEDGSGDPVVISRTDPSQLPNVVRVEILDRNNFYSATTIEARDQDAIERFGYRLGSTVTAHEITNAQAAQIIAQLILQRGLGVRAIYAFRLSWEFMLLEPMDIVTLTDTNLGLAKTPVRITTVEEDDQGLLSVTAEEVNPGIGTAVAYGVSGATGGALGTTTVPAPVTPIIFEAPSQIAGNQIEIIFGANSILGGAPDPNYGGCNIFISTDGGSTYQQLVTLNGQSTTGVLTAALPAYAGVNPDTTDTLSINLAQSGTTLDPGSQAAAQGLQTLCLVDNELVSYGSASGTPGAAYALSYLYRGVYGSSAGSHAIGGSFFYLEGLTATAVLANSTKNTTVYFKFQGFNPFGKGLQDLAACMAYPKTITGAGLTS